LPDCLEAFKWLPAAMRISAGKARHRRSPSYTLGYPTVCGALTRAVITIFVWQVEQRVGGLSVMAVGRLRTRSGHDEFGEEAEVEEVLAFGRGGDLFGPAADGGQAYCPGAGVDRVY
jgi:hypothetical protein